MSSIADLKNELNTTTTKLVLLQIATVGIFPLMLLYRHAKRINEITKTGLLDDLYLTWQAVCQGLVWFLLYEGVVTFSPVVIAVGSLLNLAVLVLWIVWAFKARKALQDYALHEFRVNLQMNAFYTLFLNIFYVTYCINDLPEVARRFEVLQSGAPVPESQKV